jgi:hypothetical protein
MAPIATKHLIDENDGVIFIKTLSGKRIIQSGQEPFSAKHLTSEHDLVLKTFRLLIADLCQQFSGGHPG